METLFTDRELEILQKICVAKNRKVIASDFKISLHTVDTHLRHIREKTQTHSLSELMIYGKEYFAEQAANQIRIIKGVTNHL